MPCTESSALGQEIFGLEALEFQMARNLDVLKQRQADAKFSKTLAGRVFNWGGRIFAVYCIYRIFSVSTWPPPGRHPQIADNSISTLALAVDRQPCSAPLAAAAVDAR